MDTLRIVCETRIYKEYRGYICTTLNLHVSQARLQRDPTEVTLDFPLHTFQHCKLTTSTFIPALFWPHPIFYPLTISRRFYLLAVN